MRTSSVESNKGVGQKSNSGTRSGTIGALRPDRGSVNKPATPSQTGFGSGNRVTPLRPGPDHEQIAARAKAIWEQRGRLPGQDLANWYEAEAHLKAEMGMN